MIPKTMNADSLPPPELWPDLLFSLPEFAYPPTLNAATELVDVHVAAGHGNDTAIIFEGARTSYRELQRVTNRIGHALLRLGVAAGDRVAIRLPNRPAFVATWLAVQKIGAVGVSTMPMLRARELAYIANDSGAKVFVCASDLLEELVRARVSFDHPVTIVAAAAPGESSSLPAGADASLDAMLATESDRLDAYAMPRD